MELIVRGLPTDEVGMIQRGGPDANGQRAFPRVADALTNPCRHCLGLIEEGGEKLVLAYRPFDDLQPYAETGPIFLHKRPCVAICRFFESTYPDPPLMGVDAVDQSLVEMWNRRIELGLFRNTADYFWHTAPFFKDQIVQLPAYAEAAMASAKEDLAWLNEALANRRFVAGDDFTIADITAQVAIDLGTPSVYTIEPELKNLARWHAEVSARPSASA